MRVVTIKDIAAHAKVSVATVSYVLNNSKKLSPAVTERVMASAQALGYRPSRSAKALRTGKSQTLGLVLPDITNPFFPILAQAVEHHARRTGYGVIFVDSNQDPAIELEGFERLAEYGVAGVIWCPVAGALPLQFHFPVVTVDRPIAGFDTVYADFKQGGRFLAEHVQALGHRHIALLSGPQHLPSARLRREGFLAALHSSITVAWEHRVDYAMTLDDTVKAQLERNLLAATPVSLIVAANDTVAIAVLKHLRDIAHQEPAQAEATNTVSVLGFDDISWATLVTPALSTIHQPVAALGETAVSLIQKRIKEPSCPLQEIVLGVELVARESARVFAPAFFVD